MKQCGIYKITIDRSAEGKERKSYIGQSIDIKCRWKGHRSNSKNKKCKQYNCPLYNAIRKYGLDNVTFEILRLVPRKELNEFEKYYIAVLDTLHPEGYNMDSGGNCPTFISEETRKKISENKKGTPAWNKGIPMDEEAKKNLSEKRKGVKLPKKHCKAISDGKKGLYVGCEHPMWGKFGKDNPTSKKVAAYCPKSKTLIKVFDSQKLAMEWAGSKTRSCISACLNGRQKTAHGYIWKRIK